MKDQSKLLLPVILVVLVALAVAFFLFSADAPLREQPAGRPDASSGGEPVQPPPSDGGDEAVCIDRCGDGQCAEIVCLGTGCPCAETAESCPEDCAAE